MVAGVAKEGGVWVMRVSLKHALPGGTTAALSSRAWRLLIEAGILLGLMLTGTWLITR